MNTEIEEPKTNHEPKLIDHPLSEITEEAQVEQPPIKRRGILKVLGATGVLMTVGVGVELKTAAISNEILTPNIAEIPRTTPPELEGKDIPEQNEHYRHNPLSVLREAIGAYEQSGGKPFYRQPPYYLTQGAMATAIIKNLTSSGRLNLESSAPSGKIAEFSAVLYDGASQLYETDPGSSMQIETKERLEVAGLRTASQPLDPDGLYAFSETERTGESARDKIIAQTYAKKFRDTKAEIDRVRGQGRVSTAKLFEYNLHKTNGDIVRSLLDTTIFLKMAARTNIQKLQGVADDLPRDSDSISGSTYESASLLSSMFYDDFARELPLEGLIANVPKDSRLNNYDEDQYTDPSKDFDPVNRAGLPYHIWNIYTLCACTEPAVVKRMVGGYYNKLTNPYDVVIEQGKVKTEADFRTIDKAEEIRDVFEEYRVA